MVEKSERIVRDPQGRFLAISCTLHGRPTLIVAAHADNNSDAEQEAFYKRLAHALEPFRPEKKPGMDYHFLMDTNNAPDWHLDYRSTASRTTQSRPLGIAAMQQLVQTFKVIDNFRELNPLRREYTRTHHLSGGHESQKRLDRSCSRQHTCIAKVAHDPRLHALRISGLTRQIAQLSKGRARTPNGVTTPP